VKRPIIKFNFFNIYTPLNFIQVTLRDMVKSSFRKIASCEMKFLYDPFDPSRAAFVEGTISATGGGFSELQFYSKDIQQRGFNRIGPKYPLLQHGNHTRPVYGKRTKFTRQQRVSVDIALIFTLFLC
jgi:hypothetical protein